MARAWSLPRQAAASAAWQPAQVAEPTKPSRAAGRAVPGGSPAAPAQAAIATGRSTAASSSAKPAMRPTGREQGSLRRHRYAGTPEAVGTRSLPATAVGLQAWIENSAWSQPANSSLLAGDGGRTARVPYFKRLPYAQTRTTQAGAPAAGTGDVMDVARAVLASATGAAPDGTLRLRAVLRPGMQGALRADVALDRDGPPRTIRLAVSDLVGPGSRIPADRIRVAPAMLDLQPGSSAEVEISIAAPEGVQPGIHAGLLTGSGEDAFACRIEAEIG